jgi:hypothetical protein
MAQESQTLKNHVRLDPLFHFFLVPASAALLIAAITNVIRNPGWSGAAHLLAALWAVIATFKIRLYALKVQDRVIRLEERLRLRELVSPALRPRISELTEAQFVGLRFASDAEVPELVDKTVAGKWNSRQIKEAIRNWRPDYWRV